MAAGIGVLAEAQPLGRLVSILPLVGRGKWAWVVLGSCAMAGDECSSHNSLSSHRCYFLRVGHSRHLEMSI